MLNVVSVVGSITLAGVFAFSGALHVARPSVLRVALQRQALWPKAAQPALAHIVTILELGIASCAMVTLAGFVTSGWFASSTFLAAAGLCAALGAYSTLVLARRPGAPCGCEGVDTPMSAVVPVRAVCLAAVAGLAAATDPAASLAALDVSQGVIVVEAGAAFMVVSLMLPSALRQGDAMASPGGYSR